MLKNTDWKKLASGILKAELKHRDIGYEQLAALLKKIGVKETAPSIRNKLSRGTFQFTFFIQCAAVIDIKNLHFDELIHR